MTFRYGSKAFRSGGVSQLGIDNHVKSLLSWLDGERADNPSRPVIFIVHGLGGLLLKEAFRYATGARGGLIFQAGRTEEDSVWKIWREREGSEAEERR